MKWLCCFLLLLCAGLGAVEEAAHAAKFTVDTGQDIRVAVLDFCIEKLSMYASFNCRLDSGEKTPCWQITVYRGEDEKDYGTHGTFLRLEQNTGTWRYREILPCEVLPGEKYRLELDFSKNAPCLVRLSVFKKDVWLLLCESELEGEKGSSLNRVHVFMREGPRTDNRISLAQGKLHCECLYAGYLLRMTLDSLKINGKEKLKSED